MCPLSPHGGPTPQDPLHGLLPYVLHHSTPDHFHLLHFHCQEPVKQCVQHACRRQHPDREAGELPLWEWAGKVFRKPKHRLGVISAHSSYRGPFLASVLRFQKTTLVLCYFWHFNQPGQPQNTYPFIRILLLLLLCNLC